LKKHPEKYQIETILKFPT